MSRLIEVIKWVLGMMITLNLMSNEYVRMTWLILVRMNSKFDLTVLDFVLSTKVISVLSYTLYYPLTYTKDALVYGKEW